MSSEEIQGAIADVEKQHGRTAPEDTMQVVMKDNLVDLNDGQLVDLAKAVASGLRVAECRMLALLGEIDARRLYAERGYPSMFAFCTELLRFSEGTASRRVAAARASRRHPMLLDLMSSGQMHLTGVAMIAPFLEDDNVSDRVGQAIGKSHRHLEHLVESWKAARRAGNDVVEVSWLDTVPTFVVPQAEPQPQPQTAVARSRAVSGLSAPAGLSTLGSGPGSASSSRLIKIRVGRSLDEKIKRARNLMAHAIPDGDTARLLEAAIDALLDKRDPARRMARRAKRGARQQATKPSRATTRRIPQAVKDQVWKRDGGRCTFASSDGHLCSSSHRLQYDHVRPFAIGGSSGDADNIRLLCATHNRWRATRTFGRAANVGGTHDIDGR